MMNNINVIVPVYKVEQYIHQCINSIVNQTYSDLKLIIIDDGSADECGRYCDEYLALDSRVIVIHQKNGGLSAARNSGIELAIQDNECEWITFIDSDDYVDYDYLDSLSSAAKKYNQSVISCSYVPTNDRNYISSNMGSNKLIPVEDYWVNNRTNATVAWGKLYRSKLFKDIRYPVGKYHEDEYVTYRVLFQHDSIAVVDAPLYCYYNNESSISGMNYLKRFPDIIEAFKMHYDYFKNSKYRNAFRLEVEKYAEAYTNAIYYCWNNHIDKNIETELRKELKLFLKEHKNMIPFEIRKDIYIAAYPLQEFFIRGFGYLKQKFVK